MKTYRQQLANWIVEKKETLTDDKQIQLIEEIQTKIKEMEDIERWMVNKAYDKGYDDKELVRSRLGNYYSETYKIHDMIKTLTNTKYGNQ